MAEAVVIDANVILRYLLQDHDLSKQAEVIVNNNNLLIRTEVLCEVVYVLQKVYAVERKKIADILSRFMNLPRISTAEPAIIPGALVLYGASSLDFVDCILIAVHKNEDMEIATFDQQLMKRLNQ